MGTRRPPQPRPAESRPRLHRLRWLVPACAMAALLGVLAWRGIDRAAPVPVAVAEAPPPGPYAPQFFGTVDVGAPAPDLRRLQRRQLVDSLLLADRVYCSYRSGSRYPAGSRPMAENVDQNRPNDPAVSTQPMRLDGGGSEPGVQVQTSQSRIYVASGESVTFLLRALDADGKALPLVVTHALAQGITYAGTRRTPQVALPFADDGTGADRTAGDGAFAGVLAPGQTGLAGFAGTIRTEVRYNAAGKSGLAQFDVIYTPELPAVWAGPVREAVEDGSLVYILKLDVRQPGRYIVNGRVDDARGQPLALLTFNDLLGPGPNEVRLTLFGRLLRDAAPAQPLTLRDVDGWLLKENTGPDPGPDRALLPRLAGKVFSGALHAADGFSDAEWQSEERSRYLTEFAKDLTAARTRLAEFDPATPLPASACLPPEPAR